MGRGWLAALLVALVLPACAHIEAPPGGPEDREPPRLLTTRPDSMARMESFLGPVVLVFSEGLSEQRVEEAVEVSPRTSALSVEKRGDEIRVDLRRGWERGRIYHVFVEPIIRDRFNNTLAQPVRLVFSTGPEIPDTRLAGRVEDRQTAQPAARVRVEAILTPDSVVYATRTDSVGAFLFERIPAGSYRVQAYSDPNATRMLDESEARDTARATVSAGQAAPDLALSIVTPDSTAPELRSAAGERDVITLRFDDFLDPEHPASAIAVQVFGPDSVPVQVAEIAVGALARRDTARADSARVDTARAEAARGDTARADSAAPRRPVPAQTLVVRLAQPLVSEGTYRVNVSGVRNLVGLEGGGSVQFRAPRVQPPAAPADSTPAPDAEEPEPPEPTDPQPTPPAEPPAPQPTEPPARRRD